MRIPNQYALVIALIGMPTVVGSQEPMVAARDSWTACVSNSFVAQIKTTRNKYLAVEQAFASCASEESVMRGVFPSDYESQDYADKVINQTKVRFKSSLIAAATKRGF